MPQAVTHPGFALRSRRRATARGLPTVSIMVLVAALVSALLTVVYILWPRWPGAVGLDAPSVPITVAGVPFNVPAAAMRMRVQRRTGAHERVDLVFLWPSLIPPDPRARPAPPAPGTGQPLERPPVDRIFVTVAVSDGTLPPAERMKTIYRRYAAKEPTQGPDGLAVLAFRNDTPYQGEDLIYDAAAPDRFLVRCMRQGVGLAPGMCLYDRRIEGAEITVRFPRDWLDDWRKVAAGIDQLIAKIRPKNS
jgi:hypothetical protein